jgi:cytochrome P450
VSRHPTIGDFWSITRAADIELVSKQPQLFSSYNHGILLQENSIAPLELMRNLVIFKDPPEHTRYRKLLQLAFTPRTISHLEDAVRKHVIDLLDAATETGAMDVVRDFALPIPLAVITDLLGAPAEDVDRLEEWTAQLDAGNSDPESGVGVEAMLDMGAYLAELIPSQLDSDSLVGLLARAEIDGDRLNEEELLLFFAILVFAGNDTTRNAAAGGILALTEQPDQLQALRANPALVPNAVEEILRWTTPLNFFARSAAEDVDLRGVRIAAGDKLVMWYASGSRDEEVLAGASRFDVTRPVDYHQAFGGGGRHFCLGAALARLELRVIFEEFTRRVRDPRLTGEPVRACSSWVNGWAHIPLAFSPG